MTSDYLVLLLHRVAAELVIRPIAFGPGQGPVEVELLALQTAAVEHAVEVERSRLGQCLLLPHRIVGGYLGPRPVIERKVARRPQAAGIVVADAVDPGRHRVYRQLQGIQVLTDILVLHDAVVHAVEVGIEGNHDLFQRKGLPTIGNIGGTGALVAQVLKRLAVVEGEE